MQASRDANSAESQDMPSYSTPGADLLTANIRRSVETEEHSEILDSTIQRQSEPGRAAVAATAPPIMSIPVVQPNSVGIQRQCSECAEKQQQPSEEEGKDVLELSQAASGIQTKLTVGAIGDAYEQEADRVAAQVMSMPVAAAAPRQVQRFGEEPSPVGMYSSLARSITPVVHRRVDQQVQMRELVQRAFEAGGNEASGDLESRLNASSGGGNALAPEVRAFMEPRFGADFSSVRVHTGGEAVQMNRELGAQAFAHGSDIYFGAGKEPGNNELTAHELTHVVQQTGMVQLQRQPTKALQNESGKGTKTLVAQANTNQSLSPEEYFICLLICACDVAPNVPVGKNGQKLKQVCVSKVLQLIDFGLDYKSPIKAEINYDMTQNPPQPIMSRRNPLRGTEYLPARVREIPNFKPGTGMVRRPDAVIVNDPTQPPTQGNIKKVVEIKFPGDVLDAAQGRAYERIAGAANRFSLLDPKRCGCDELKKNSLEVLKIIAEIVALSAAAALVAGDDATGIGVIDDALLAPLTARLAFLIRRLTTLAPRLLPLLGNL